MLDSTLSSSHAKVDSETETIDSDSPDSQHEGLSLLSGTDVSKSRALYGFAVDHPLTCNGLFLFALGVSIGVITALLGGLEVHYRESNEVPSSSPFDDTPPSATTSAVFANVLPTERLILIGERNSGTNYIQRTLLTAFKKYQGKEPKSVYSMKLPVLGNKHMFRHNMLSDEELDALMEATANAVFLFVVRNPFDWADGMKRKPWHMCPPDLVVECTSMDHIGLNPNATMDMTREEFLKMPWRDFAEIDKGEMENYTYSNVFELRKHKLQLMKQIMNRVGPERVKIAHLHQVEAAPARFLDEVAANFGLIMDENYVAPEPSTYMHSTLCYSGTEYEFAHNAIDWEWEGKFGFVPGDARRCFGT